ncbi:MAG: hypothetical protein AAGE01_10270 [Pseudomonadota bacterium]
MEAALATAAGSGVASLANVRAKIETEIGQMVGARELRILSMRKSSEGGWTARIEAFVRDPQLSINNQLGNKEILEVKVFQAEFDSQAELIGFDMEGA